VEWLFFRVTFSRQQGAFARQESGEDRHVIGVPLRARRRARIDAGTATGAPQILRTACGFLGPDHLGEVCDDDLYLSHAKTTGVDCKLGVAAGEAAGWNEMSNSPSAQIDSIPRPPPARWHRD
jgi:hypothetical protein